MDASIPLQDLDVLLQDPLGVANAEGIGGATTMTAQRVPMEALHMATTWPMKTGTMEPRVDGQTDI